MQPIKILQTLKILHLSVLAGPIAFAVFAYLQKQSFNAEMDVSDIFTYIVPIAAASGYFIGIFLFQKRIRSLKKEDSLQSKLGTYQTALLVKYALLEGPSVLALIAYHLSGNALHLVIAISLLAYLYAQRPTKEQLIKEIPLNLEERKSFDTFQP